MSEWVSDSPPHYIVLSINIYKQNKHSMTEWTENDDDDDSSFMIHVFQFFPSPAYFV